MALHYPELDPPVADKGDPQMPVFTQESMDRFRAESRLKEAGPELLAALIDMVDMHDMDVTDGTIKTAKGSERWRRVEAARAAIATATNALG